MDYHFFVGCVTLEMYLSLFPEKRVDALELLSGKEAPYIVNFLVLLGMYANRVSLEDLSFESRELLDCLDIITFQDAPSVPLTDQTSIQTV